MPDSDFPPLFHASLKKHPEFKSGSEVAVNGRAHGGRLKFRGNIEKNKWRPLCAPLTWARVSIQRRTGTERAFESGARGEERKGPCLSSRPGASPDRIDATARRRAAASATLSRSHKRGAVNNWPALEEMPVAALVGMTVTPMTRAVNVSRSRRSRAFLSCVRREVPSRCPVRVAKLDTRRSEANRLGRELFTWGAGERPRLPSE